MKDNPSNWFLNLVGAFFTAVQPDDILRWISLGLTILATIISIAFTVYKWYNKAKADGKITPEEVKELTDTIFNKEDKE